MARQRRSLWPHKWDRTQWVIIAVLFALSVGLYTAGRSNLIVTLWLAFVVSLVLNSVWG